LSVFVPSIDISNGKAVQLRRSEELVIVDQRTPEELAERLGRYGEIAVIDLDAAKGKGDNFELVKRLCRIAPVRAGGGIRTVGDARELLRAGAEKLIIGTAATPEFLSQLPRERVMVALDVRGFEVLDAGWTRSTGEDIFARAERLKDYCSGFLCTFVEDEGTLSGLNRRKLEQLAKRLPLPITVAGGVDSADDVLFADSLGVDVQIGMAWYKGKLDYSELFCDLVRIGDSLVPTIVQDTSGQVLMLAWSNRESLIKSLDTGQATYYSRSRRKLWTKGETSGNTQKLLRCMFDCDRDALLFIVEQKGVACHTGSFSCFGPKQFSMLHLEDKLRRRAAERVEGSYTVKLIETPNLLGSKIREEARELADAKSVEEVIWEAADVIYHLMVKLVSAGVSWSDVMRELRGRE